MITLGNTNINEMSLGSMKIAEAYLGSQLVFQADPFKPGTRFTNGYYTYERMPNEYLIDGESIVFDYSVSVPGESIWLNSYERLSFHEGVWTFKDHAFWGLPANLEIWREAVRNGSVALRFEGTLTASVKTSPLVFSRYTFTRIDP